MKYPYEISVTNAAWLDIKSIKKTPPFLGRSVSSINKQIELIIDTIKSLRYFPYRFAILDEAELQKKARKAKAGKYNILYDIDEEKVEVRILRIFHASIGPKRLQDILSSI